MAFFDKIATHYRARRTNKVLNALSDRQLDDIGLSRADISPNRPTFVSDKFEGIRPLV